MLKLVTINIYCHKCLNSFVEPEYCRFVALKCVTLTVFYEDGSSIHPSINKRCKVIDAICPKVTFVDIF